MEVVHNGIFCGVGGNLSYLSASSASIDYCSAKTWSISVIDEILKMLDYVRDGKLHVYWCMPGKDIADGLTPMETDLQCIEMIKASGTHKTLVLFLDHNNALRRFSDDVIVNGGPSLPPVISPRNQAITSEEEHMDSVDVSEHRNEEEARNEEAEMNEEHGCGTDSDCDSDFHDSDCNAEEGDDDLFADNVDTSVNDCNEKEVTYENEDEDALEDQELHLPEVDRQQLVHKFRAFNPEIDMDNPTFKIGMVFSGVGEVRKAISAYSVRNRVKIRKIKNDFRRVDGVCADGCTWKLKTSKDSRSGGFIVTSYVDTHTCEQVWDLKVLTAKLLADKFLQEFRDNQKLDLKGFAAKVTREFNMCPDRWKLGRARKAALQQIHGDEEAQFRQLYDYGQELRRSNPGSKFFITTNSVNDPATGEHKAHLATIYWSYDACKRGFLEGCRPLICLDGCHIKTRYKGQLLTAVGIDPNDCIFPIAFGLVEVECTSSWEWFLSNLKDDLNITNTSPWTIMSDKQKVWLYSFYLPSMCTRMALFFLLCVFLLS